MRASRRSWTGSRLRCWTLRTRWRDRRLLLFTEWDDTRRWLVERLKEGLLQRSRGRADLNGRILVFTGQTSLEERDRIKIAFNAPFDQEPVRILVCTDAAREGLNLQARCHDLVHFDLPWNPSRLEQRNGRIDRKLQPSKVVTCRYFVYAQWEEDRVLDALVRKTEVIRRQLGAAGEVLRMRMEQTLTREGIRRGEAARLAESITDATSDQVKVAERELGDETDRRIARLKEEQDRLQRALDHAKKRVGVDGADIRRVVEIALKDDGAALRPGRFSVPEAVFLDPDTPSFAKDPSWASLFDELRPGRPGSAKDRARWRRETPIRGLVFEAPRARRRPAGAAGRGSTPSGAPADQAADLALRQSGLPRHRRPHNRSRRPELIAARCPDRTPVAVRPRRAAPA